MVQSYVLKHLNDTQELGNTLARDLLDRPCPVCLWGDLGSGKTCLARAIITSIFMQYNLSQPDVISPTFTLVNEYITPDLTIYHLDLYRIEDRDELWQIGLNDMVLDGLVLLEWPQRLEQNLPVPRLDVHLNYGDENGMRLAKVSMIR